MDGDLGSEKHYLTNANSKNKLFKFIILIAFVLFIIVLAFIGLVYFAYWKYSDSVPYKNYSNYTTEINNNTHLENTTQILFVCGDGVCNGTETIRSCYADCRKSSGGGGGGGDSGGSGGSRCTPNCDGKNCGSDGCGGTCGSCGEGYECNSSRSCVLITASCVNDLGCSSPGTFCGEIPYNCTTREDGCFDRSNLSFCSSGYECINGSGCIEIPECTSNEDCGTMNSLFCSGDLTRNSTGVCNSSGKCESKYFSIENCSLRDFNFCSGTNRYKNDFSCSLGGCTNTTLLIQNCNDGLYCNGAESCSASGCVPGVPINCADSVSCTTDGCNEASDSCVHTANDALCSSSQYCDLVNGCLTRPTCSGTDISCGAYPSCSNCNSLDGCYSGQRRDYYCSSNSCIYRSITAEESPTNGNCNDGIDNDCDGSIDVIDSGCAVFNCNGKDECSDYANEVDCNNDLCHFSCSWQGGVCKQLAGEGQNVLILANLNSPESIELAQFYAQKRGVPTDQILYLETTTSEYISFNSTTDPYNYNKSIEFPTKQKILELEGKGRKIRYIVTTYGIPAYMIVPGWLNWGYGNERSTDSYISAMFYNTYQSQKDMMINPYYYTYSCKNKKDPYCTNITHFKDMTFSFRFFLVTRLDGSLLAAKNMMSRALYAEKYFSNETSEAGYFMGGYYVSGHPCSGVHWPRGFDCYSDYTPKTGTETFSEQKTSNLFYNEYSFVPGAFSPRFQSFSASGGLRNPSLNTHAVGSIFSGATAVSGAANEPYASGLVRIDKFWDAFLLHHLVEPTKDNFNFAEAAYYSTYYVRWMPIMIGDPLFKYPKQAYVDSEVPLIENVVTNVMNSHAVNITFKTEKSVNGNPELSRAYIEYGATSSYGSAKNESQYYNYLDSYAYPYNAYHSVVLDGLKSNTLYHYRITVIDPKGNLQRSGDLTFNTNSFSSDPLKDFSLFSLKAGKNLVSLKWSYTDVKRVDKFQIFRNDVLIGETDKNFYIDSNVFNGQNYRYKIRVRDVNGNYGSFSFENSVTPKSRNDEINDVYIVDDKDAGFVYEAPHLFSGPFFDYPHQEALGGSYTKYDFPIFIGNISYYFNVQQDGFYKVYTGTKTSDYYFYPGRKALIFHNGTYDYQIEITQNEGAQAGNGWQEKGIYYFKAGLNKIIFTGASGSGMNFDGIKLEKTTVNGCYTNPGSCGTFQMGYGKPVDPSILLLYHFDNRSDLGENQNLIRDFSGKGNDGTFFSGIVSDQVYRLSSESWGSYPFSSRILVSNIKVGNYLGMFLEMTSGANKGFSSNVAQGLTETWTDAAFAVKDSFPNPLAVGDTFSIYADKTKSFSYGLSGKSINSDSLDGVSCKLKTPLNLSKSKDFTVEVWFKKNDSERWAGYMVDLWGLGFSVWNGELSVFYSSWFSNLYPDGNRIYISSDPNYWQHFVLTNENSKVKMYLNGRYLGDVALTSSFDNQINDISVGKFLGQTDEFVLYNRALTESEIINNFQAKYALTK